MEPTSEAQEQWLEHVHEVSDGTPWTAPSCNSWYLGANIEGKTRTILPYTGGVGRYREICDEVAADGYRGFRFAESVGSATPA
jgi:cyclohexanone monooxygenase